MIDCFIFFNELELLEIRLNSLAPYVNKFVLCESPVTFAGNSKPLYFQENKDRFKDFNITHLIVDDYEKWLGYSAWFMEYNQRNFLKNGILSESDEEIILMSDIDEIPDLSQYDGETEGSFRQKMFYYYFNVVTGQNNWRGTVAIKKKNIDRFQKLRDKRNQMHTILRQGGWHFSTLGPIENIILKIESFSHTEHNIPEIKENIPDKVLNLKDPYNRNFIFRIEEPSGPKWLLENKERYPHLWL